LRLPFTNQVAGKNVPIMMPSAVMHGHRRLDAPRHMRFGDYPQLSSEILVSAVKWALITGHPWTHLTYFLGEKE
jgi:hypothetical protein